MDSRTNNEKRKRRNNEKAEVRAEYKDLGKRLKVVDKEEDLAAKLELVKSNLERSDELYSRVKKNLAGTAADSKLLRETVDLAQRTSKLININTKPFDIRKIIRNVKKNEETRLNEKLNQVEFAKFIVNKHVSKFLCNPPTFEYFYGMINIEDLVIVKRKNRVRGKLVESKAVTAKERNIETDVEQDSTPKEVEHIYKQIRKLTRKSRTQNVSFFETLVDPKSFTQTVENIFHTSFLVKEGQVGVRADKDKSAVLTIEKNSDSSSQRREREQNSARKEAKQSIFSFSMEDYKNWISRYQIRELAFKPRQFDSNSNSNSNSDDEDDNNNRE